MKLFTFFIIISSWCYATDSLKRLEDELKYLDNREAFLYLPKRELLVEKTDEVKTTSSAILKPYTEEEKEGLLEEMERDTGFRELPINAPEKN